MVAASPSGVAAVLSLGTYLIPFNNTSGSFLDLIGSELYLHSRVRRLLPAAAFPRHWSRADTALGEAWPGAGRRTVLASPGPRLASGRGRGSWLGVLQVREARARENPARRVKPPGASPWWWKFRHVACGGYRLAASGRPRKAATVHAAWALGLAGAPAGRPGALGTGKWARRGGGGPRCFQFSLRLLVTV